MPPKPTSGRNQQVEEPEAASSNPAMDDIQRTLNQLVGSMRELFDANREIREEMHTLKEEVQVNRPRGGRDHQAILEEEDEEELEPPRRRNQDRRRETEDGKIKHQLPEFLGKADPDLYLEWETNVDKVFSLHNYSEQYKVGAAIAEFRQNANTWWLDVMRRRRRDGEGEVTTWRELKRLMRATYVPKTYQKKLRSELQDLRQGTRSCMEFYYELIALRSKLQIDESDDAMEARFIRGLNRNIRDQAEIEAMKCNSLEEVVAFADLIEKHLKEKESRSRFTPGGSTSKPTPPKKPMPSSSTSQPKIVVKPTVNNLPKKVITPPQGQERRVQCFKCKGWGHYAKDCVNQRVMHFIEDGEIFSEDEESALEAEREQSSLPFIETEYVTYSSDEEAKEGERKGMKVS
ncbi:OLC1v1024451C1 [Oldenlandia corymbosa var. corymbosa]|uniref:OLC1v1024451C1 n=1 Tax=Oldenlandia corymbosa var. corymbosa TaxID=529605 RepID=A0AAV1C3A8_OLDCO|nr:OLC1v1024451C1 [Oldenlandia corymbosa var. corymbosa]